MPFVVGGVSNTGQIETSEDGITWALHEAGHGSGFIIFRGAAYSPSLGLFVLGGDFGKVATSPDGVTWTSQTSNFGTLGQERIDAVGWSPELSLFVITGGEAALSTSPDGVNWTSRTSGFTVGEQDIYAIAWSPSLGLFVIVGEIGGLATSPDGINWTVGTSGFESTFRGLDAAAWSPELGLFVVAGINGAVATSPDGTSWTHRTAGGGTEGWASVAWSPENGRFVMGSFDGVLVTSEDGIIWTTRSIGINNHRAVAWSSEIGLFVVVNSSGLIATSPDGITWTTQTDNSEPFILFCAVASTTPPSTGRVFVGIRWSTGTPTQYSLYLGDDSYDVIWKVPTSTYVIENYFGTLVNGNINRVEALDGNLYWGTTNGFPNFGVRELVSVDSPTTESELDTTSDLSVPQYLAVRDGVLYCNSGSGGWNQIFSVSSSGYTNWTGDLHALSGSTWPAGGDFAFRPSDGTCWVLSPGSRDLMMLSATGVWGGLGSAHWLNTAANPYPHMGLTWHDDVLYIADQHRIWTFDPVTETFTLLVDLSSLTTLDGIRDVTVASDRIHVLTDTNPVDFNAAIVSCALDGSDPRIDVSYFDWFPRSIMAVQG